MKTYYKGYVVDCSPNEAWNGSFKSNFLSVYKKGPGGNSFIASKWTDKKVRDGVKEGKEIVDKHLQKKVS